MAREKQFYRDRFYVMAHRGARGLAPENTLAAFRTAIEVGADAIELDVQPCATGELVIIHDGALERTTNGHGAVAETSFADLRALDAGAWFGPQFAGERIPTPGEALDLARGRLLVNIEIKTGTPDDLGVEAALAEAIRARNMEGEVLISSFNPAALLRMKKLAPELPRALIYSNMRVFPQDLALLALEALHPRHTLVNAAMVNLAHSRGYAVNAWTVNEPADMEALVALGVDAITSDYPERLRRIVPGG
ncbi:MAG: glycerophosphodiester phosphodiesterase [Chloroflexi bacterium]|nr:glycerophosphodiester phosphodiesterase [Chloroflexota bacterium]